MKKEYDFSKAEKGKFYTPLENTQIPIYLEDDILEFFKNKLSPNQPLEELINKLLRNDIDIIKNIAVFKLGEE